MLRRERDFPRPYLGVLLPGRVPEVSFGWRNGLRCLHTRTKTRFSRRPAGSQVSRGPIPRFDSAYLPLCDGFFGFCGVVTGGFFRQESLLARMHLRGNRSRDEASPFSWGSFTHLHSFGCCSLRLRLTFFFRNFCRQNTSPPYFPRLKSLGK